MVLLIITLLQWEFVVTTMVIFFSVGRELKYRWLNTCIHIRIHLLNMVLK